MKILIVDRDNKTRSQLSNALIDQGYFVQCASNDKEAIACVQSENPHLVLLEHHGGSHASNSFLTTLKKSGNLNEVPVIVLGHEFPEKDILQIFDQGADDFIPKPFNTKILVRRIGAIIKRLSKNNHDTICRWNTIELNPETHKVTVAGQEQKMTVMEFNILKCLLKAPGQVFRRDDILKAVNGQEVSIRTIDVHVCALRKKLRRNGEDIETVRGVGYRLPDPHLNQSSS